MAGEVVEKTQEQLDQEAFQAGFSGKGPTETPDPIEAEIPPVEEIKEEPKYAQLTQQQLDDLMARSAVVDELKATQDKSFGTAFVKIGGIERALQAIQAATPTGAAVEIAADDFAELTAEYPELAELQVKGLNKVLAKLKGSGSDPAALDKLVDTRVNERVSALTQQAIDAQLDAIVGGDWVAAVKSDEYKAWQATFGDEQKKLEASTSLRDAANLMRQFKAHKPAAETPPTSSRKQQLQAAVPPKGSGGHQAPPAGDAFAEGFKTGRA